ncbi:hypothetical protein [Anaerostipes sp.]|uniref:hypothetical protein n=1 Tax=Anaerostipes sp. TaxID=1872530 RepID=UPI0025BD1CFF|nr:hypothetical protein [Anaerostipes sp.]MBS7009217.1 hypothetical protein [Anaerostipes sp.]
MRQKEKKIILGLSIAVALSIVLNVVCYVSANKEQTPSTPAADNITAKTTATEEEKTAAAEKNTLKSTTASESKDNTTGGIAVDAGSINDYSKCLNIDVYKKITCSNSGGYSFVYPQNFFNHVSSDKNGKYVFSADDGVTEYTVFSQKATAGSAKQEVKNLAADYEDEFSHFYFKFPKEGIKKSGAFCRKIYGGYLNSDKSIGQYMIIASNGTYDYILIFKYKADDKSDNPKGQADYLADCFYRGASFSGSTKEIRTYNEFLTDES